MRSLTAITEEQRREEVRRLAAGLLRLCDGKFTEAEWRGIAARARQIERRAVEMYKRLEAA